MNNEILWLIRFGLSQKLFTRDQALATVKAVGRAAEVTDFAQRLIDDGVVTDLEKLESLIDQSITRAQVGPPDGNPLLDDTTPPVEAARPAAAAAGGTARPAATMAVATGGVPSFPFDQIEAMDDKSLAAALRKLLIDAGKYGASDLHLSAGSKPFVRRLRALNAITDHVLTAEESLRLNTVLLAEHQKKIYLERRDYDLALALDANNR